MRLDFDSMELWNFWSFLGHHVFDMADRREGGLFFLRGRNLLEPDLGANDAGKSTLLRAFMWCLFGHTQEGLGTPDVKPWAAGKSKETTRVVVYLDVDGKAHKIERRAETNGLYLDGKSCGQADINRLLQMNDVLFQHTILLGQGEPLFFDLPPAKKMELFVEALALERWDARAERAGDEAKDLEKTLAIMTASIGILSNNEMVAKRRMQDAKKSADYWKEGRDERIDGYNNLLAEAERELTKQVKLRDEADLVYDGSGTELKALRSEKEQMRSQLTTAQSQESNATLKMAMAKERIREMTDELNGLSKTAVCPTCGQSIKKADLGKHKKELQERRSSQEDMIDEYKRLIKTAGKERQTFENALALIRTRMEEFETKEADALSRRTRLVSVVAKLEADVRSLKQKIADEEQAKNIYEEQFKKAKRELSDAKADIEKIQKDIDATNALIMRTKPWIKGFKDVRLYILNEVFKELEFVTNGMLPDVGLHDWAVHYDVEKETKAGTVQRGLNVCVLSPRNKKPVKWKCWGGGVAQRLRVVGALALSETLLTHAGVECNLEILDEPASHMTKGGVRDLCDYLAWRANETGKTIWFIDHMSVESDRFADIATVVKDKGGSRIQWD